MNPISLKELCLQTIHNHSNYFVYNLNCGDFKILPLEFIKYILNMEKIVKPFDIRFLRLFAHSQISSFNLDMFDLNGLNLDSLFSTNLFQTFYFLESISLVKSNITNYGLYFLSRNHSENLKYLNLSECKLLNYQSLDILKEMRKLEVLILESCDISLLDWKLEQKFIEVNIGDNQIHLDALSSLASACGDTLVRLNIWGCYCFGDIDDEQILLQFYKLKKICLKYVAPLSPYFQMVLGSLISQLDWLDLEYTQGIDLLSLLTNENSNNNITYMNISHSSSTIHMNNLFQLYTLKTIRYLHLSNVYCDLDNVHELNSSEFLFAPMQSLKELYLDNSYITLPRQPLHLVDPIRIFPSSLQVLSISGCSWIDQYESYVIDNIQLLNLKKLYMAEVKLNSVNWIKVFENKQRLKVLDVHGSNFDVQIGISLLSKNRSTLESINISKTSIKMTDVMKLEYFPNLHTFDFIPVESEGYQDMIEQLFSSDSVHSKLRRESLMHLKRSRPSSSSLSASGQQSFHNQNCYCSTSTEESNDEKKNVQAAKGMSIDEILACRRDILSNFNNPFIKPFPGLSGTKLNFNVKLGSSISF